MDPIKTQGYAQAVGFNPGTAPNTAEQQRRQDEEFIRQFKETKELELNQEATALARIKKNNELERQSLGEYSRRKDEYESQQDKIKFNQIEREYKAQQQVAGMNSSDKRFNDALNLVTDLSKTAIDAAVSIKGEANKRTTNQAESDATRDYAMGNQAPSLSGDYDADKSSQFNSSVTDLGAKQQDIANTTIQLKQESSATQMGLTGFPDVEARLKNQNSLYKQTYTKTIAGFYGKSYGQETLVELQQEQSDNPDKTYIIDGEETAISELDLSKSETLKKVLQARIPEFLKQRGLNEYSSVGLGDFYKNAILSTDQVVGTIRGAEINEQKEDRRDKAKTIFQMEPNPLNAKFLYTTLTQSGLSNAEARKGMWQQWAQLPEAEFRSMGDMPFGPNNKSFREQYPDEWRDAVTQRNSYIEAGRKNTKFAQESGDEEQLLQIQSDYLEDIKDGTFDADPAVLSEAANQAELEGRPKSAAALRSKIELTKNKQYDSRFLEGMKSDMDLGILNYNAQQIADNPSLSGDAKREALNLISQYNQTAVPQDIATADKGIMNAAIRNRAGVNTFTKGPADMSVKIMEKKAWNRYRKVYKQEYERTGSISAASEAALADFQNSFGDDAQKGIYKINAKITGTESGKYVNGTISGKAYSSGIKLNEVNINVEKNGQAAFSKPDLYTGEKEELTSMLEGANTGKINIPATLQRVQDNSGGNMSMRQLLNQRLKANGLDEIPKDVGKLADEVEQSFDPRYNKYLNYKPSFVRTDIASIGSGQDPIYTESTPMQEKIKAIFSSRESPQAAYDAINRGSGGDTPGGATKRYGKPLTQMTLGEVKQLQATELNAVGKYQFIETTLRDAAADAGISDDMLFNEAVQDRIFFVHLDKYGAYNPWERWWIEQGGSHLALSNKEKQIIETFRDSYDPSKPWRQPRNMRPELMGVD